MQHAQKVAVELLQLEIAQDLWKPPAKMAERLAAFEARYDAIVKRLHTHCVCMYRQELAAADPDKAPALSAPAGKRSAGSNSKPPAEKPAPPPNPPPAPASTLKDDPFA